jgi:N-acetyl-gamma-glutamyl-phosphate reductase
MTATAIPAIVLGGTGYVAGELLRLLAQHPSLQVLGVMSESQAGTPVREVFPQLHAGLGELSFVSREQLLDMMPAGPLALFSAAPHGASAALVQQFVDRAAQRGTALSIVDVSADFRFPTNEAYAAVYGHDHGAPALLNAFRCALPEHLPATDRPHVGHPGCFATALLMATVPLMGLRLTDGDLHANGITGSTGSGRSPGAGTHHPERHANLFAYKPLSHRHSPEVIAVCEAVTGHRPALRFVPHSGPFARGIHLTLQARLASRQNADALRDAFAGFYADSEFVTVRDGMPRIKDVIGSNYCHIGVATDGDCVAVFVVIDNLCKGAAGGAVQWMNRLLGLPEATGLTAPALAWA